MKKIILVGFGILALSSFGVAQKKAPAAAAAPKATNEKGKMITITKGLQYEDLKVGAGDEAKAGKTVTVHYTGWLTDGPNGTPGTKFDSSVDRGSPFVFPLGGGQVIKGWDQGFAGMKIGGKRKLHIDPEMGYGSRGAPPVIPPNAKLVFEVELLAVK